jgi:hypothetical protein
MFTLDYRLKLSKCGQTETQCMHRRQNEYIKKDELNIFQVNLNINQIQQKLPFQPF